MEKFYPKDFVLWRPHLLLLLIFLEAIFDSTGLFTGAEAKIHHHRQGRGDYGDYCAKKEDCRGEFHCDTSRSECLCRNFINSDLVLFYHKPLDKCLAAAGRICILPSVKDDLWKIECVPSATCTKSESVKQPNLFGICQCNEGYEETKHRLCVPADEIVEGDNGGIVSMAQKSGRGEDLPYEGNMEPGSPGWGSSTERNPGNKILKETTDPNYGIEIHRDVGNCLDLQKGSEAETKCLRREVSHAQLLGPYDTTVIFMVCIGFLHLLF